MSGYEKKGKTARKRRRQHSDKTYRYQAKKAAKKARVLRERAERLKEKRRRHAARQERKKAAKRATR